MLQVVPLKDIRGQLSEYFNQVIYGRSQVVVTRFGKPKAAIISYDDYEKVMNPQARFSQEEWGEGFAVFDKILKRTKVINSNKIEKAVFKAIAEVRKSKGGKGRY